MKRGQDSEARFGQNFKFKFSRDADVWLRFFKLMLILKLKFDQDLCNVLAMFYTTSGCDRCEKYQVCEKVTGELCSW